MPRALLAMLTGVLAVGGAGCQSTYLEQTERLRRHWSAGDVEAASREATRKARKNTNNIDTVIWRLEQGATLRATKDYSESSDALEAAAQKIEAYERGPMVRFSRQTAATFSNLDNLPYKGYTYDEIMLHTYKALNYLAVGDKAKARVELNRAQESQEEAVEENAARIEQAQKEMESDGAKLKQTRKSAQFQQNIARIRPPADKLKAYKDYVNPFTVYLDGLYFMTSATGPSDLERAHTSFERVAGMLEEDAFARQDLKAVDAMFEGKELPPLTYVLFESGLAPIRDQVRIDLPIILVTEEVPYVGAAFPKLEFRGHYVPEVTIRTGESRHETERVADMDSIIAQDFNNHLPVIITRTLLASAIKAAATYGLQEGMEAAGMPGIIGALLGAGYQMAVNVADLRTWTTLPKEFQVARLETPSDGRLHIQVGSYSRSLTVPSEGVHVVYVKSITRTTDPVISHFSL